ncbi:MAG: DUF998 domain-containing protein [Chloroflexia bacterium]|nr:DUF998 domain-containing protein [Chloroflexia bacterium]
MDYSLPTRRRQTAVVGLATVGLVGVLVNAAVLLAAPLLRPEIGLLDGALSQYAVGPWAALQNVGFVALGVSSLAIAAALSLTPTGSPWLLVGTALLALAATACIGMAAFPMGAVGPATPLGDTHQTATTLAVGCQLGSMLATAIAFRTDPAWRSLVPPGLLLFSTALIGALLTQAELLWPELPIPFGVVMRIVVIPLLIWWALVALRLRAHPG